MILNAVSEEKSRGGVEGDSICSHHRRAVERFSSLLTHHVWGSSILFQAPGRTSHSTVHSMKYHQRQLR